MIAPDQEPTVRLRRTLTLPLLTLYGVGVTVGAGIYVLTGKVIGVAGVFAPVSFLLAALLAGLSALSFAELAVRMPRAAGEALYVREGLGSSVLALVVGLAVVAMSMATAAAALGRRSRARASAQAASCGACRIGFNLQSPYCVCWRWSSTPRCPISPRQRRGTAESMPTARMVGAS